LTNRLATCQCGQLGARCEGEPLRVSVCHCLDCQKRSGASFAAQARFAASHVAIAGESRSWSRTGDEGSTATFHSCPVCSSTVFYLSDAHPDVIAVPVGAFADPAFPPPVYSVYEGRKHAWVAITSQGTAHYD
jgi:hypothetical protein